MARPLRIEFPGAVYHVFARGNARGRIFRDDRDRERLLGTVARTAERYHLLVYAWCLMPNHYHLVVETPRGGLARAIHHANGAYAQAFNRRHRRVGHVLQGRYKSILVQRDSYLLEVARYVVLNPVRAGICRYPEEYTWSSYRATAGLALAPQFLSASRLLAYFGPDATTARASYRRFVAAGVGLPDPSLQRRGIVLGDEEFVTWAMARADTAAEVPRAEREPDRPSLASVLANDDERAIVAAHRDHGYTLIEIAGHLDCHYSTVSRRLRALEDGRDPPPRRRRRRPRSGERMR